ncbi:MAG TPA: serine/threonine protein kinase, partial [Gammaproteobacteria bacterium]|nr:serine/threonine protein kinase [Gammaproteobacteria bacterium]
MGGVTRQGSFDGTNCTYSPSFVSFSGPLTVNLEIPFITGTHIFQDTLAVGENVTSGTAPAGGTGPALTIAAGNTLAFLDSGDYVVINRGSQLIAQGSPTAPITFTGFTDAVTGTAGPEDVQLWGGMVINGNGITNNCTDAQRASNDCHVVSEGQPVNYGGNDNTESSGILRYVVVKHTGFEVAPDDELNGITFNAVGSGTEVSHIETYSTYDDGIEFFGGAVDLDHYVSVY